ncbi:MAG: hypothetical protein HY579_09390 [Nitrospinae bacterium]|nr:hypothetical protein [Nitrospinota bacterium]
MRRTFPPCLALIAGIVWAGVLGTPLQGLAQGFATLKLEAAPEKDTLVPGEPLTLKLRLINPTQSPVMAHRSIDPGYGTIEVYLAAPGSGFKRYLGPGWGKHENRPQKASIAPGDAVYKEITLLFHNVLPGREDVLPSVLPLDKPGPYRVRVDFYNIGFDEKISSPDVLVRVVEPAGPDAAVWKEVLSDPEMAYFLQQGDARKGPAVAEKAERLIMQYPGSIHAKYLALALGRHYLRVNDASKAMTFLKQASGSPPKSFLRIQALMDMARGHILLREELDEAKKLCDGAASEFAESGLQRAFSELCGMVRQDIGQGIPK